MGTSDGDRRWDAATSRRRVSAGSFSAITPDNNSQELLKFDDERADDIP
jgi:hypothetical protein